MSWISTGDRAQTFHMYQRSAEVKTEMLRLTSELSSGRKSDLGKALGGDFAGLAAVERGLRLGLVYKAAADEAALHTSVMQDALQTVQTQLDETGPTLLAAVGAGWSSNLGILAVDSGARLDLVVNALNGRIAGRSLFSGDRPDQIPLISGDEMLANLGPLVAGAATAQDMIAIVEDWFLAPGGGFETTAYRGGTSSAAGFTVGDGDVIDADVSALAPEIRGALAAFALSALVGNDLGPADEASQRTLLEAAATRMIGSQGGLSKIRAELGAAEARIETARVRNSATETALSIEHNRLVRADPYTTATELEAVQMQLESLFVLTSRMARLNLTEFLR
ncbi:flagellin [Rhodophyticola porphyridii]|uniref:flagellin n=1 Tax=Rhodophyticola porphyridii TaxID=1852017 RepID=UPI0035D01B57